MFTKAIKHLLGRKQTYEFIRKIEADPLNPEVHLQYAVSASKRGRPYLAYAELKTAAFLGADLKQIEKYAKVYRSALPNSKCMAHNLFFRYKTLATEIMERNQGAEVSVLDVGGGEGILASFLPENVAYCLAEPEINGISGTCLPFPDHSFGYVLSCHVLEHIPVEERPLFLDQLLAKSQKGVILLNPFHIDGTYVDERLELVIEVTNAAWAKEHLECSLPRLEYLRNYAAERGLDLSMKPNGTMATSLAFYFMDYFGSKRGRGKNWQKINAFFNEHYCDILDSDKYPTAYLVHMAHIKR